MSSEKKVNEPKCNLPRNRTNCQREACRIQDCLAANRYQSELCEKWIKELYECCMHVYDRNKKIPVNCPNPENNPLVQQRNKLNKLQNDQQRTK